MESPNNKVSSRERLEIAARSLVNQRDLATVGRLTGAVLSVSHYLQLPPSYRQLLHDKIETAEYDFWRNESAGIQEFDLANAFNGLDDRSVDLVTFLKLPEFARTNEEQIRFLRSQMVADSPAFMAFNVAALNWRVGGRTSPAMSPLQALHLVLTLMDQKFYNPTYQVSLEHWAESRARHEESAANNAPGVQHSIKQLPADKLQQLRQALDESVASLSGEDSIQLLAYLERTLNGNRPDILTA
jgi:hypothetical protein